MSFRNNNNVLGTGNSSKHIRPLTTGGNFKSNTKSFYSQNSNSINTQNFQHSFNNQNYQLQNSNFFNNSHISGIQQLQNIPEIKGSSNVYPPPLNSSKSKQLTKLNNYNLSSSISKRPQTNKNSTRSRGFDNHFNEENIVLNSKDNIMNGNQHKQLEIDLTNNILQDFYSMLLNFGRGMSESYTFNRCLKSIYGNNSLTKDKKIFSQVNMLGNGKNSKNDYKERLKYIGLNISIQANSEKNVKKEEKNQNKGHENNGMSCFSYLKQVLFLL